MKYLAELCPVKLKIIRELLVSIDFDLYHRIMNIAMPMLHHYLVVDSIIPICVSQVLNNFVLIEKIQRKNLLSS